METEKRKQVRYSANDGVSAVLSIPGELEALRGKVVDMSDNGIAVAYEGSGKPYLGPALLDLFGSQSGERAGLTLSGIPCNIVNDSDDSSAEGASGQRRCGIHFTELSPNDVDLVRHFIRNNRSNAGP